MEDSFCQLKPDNFVAFRQFHSTTQKIEKNGLIFDFGESLVKSMGIHNAHYEQAFYEAISRFYAYILAVPKRMLPLLYSHTQIQT